MLPDTGTNTSCEWRVGAALSVRPSTIHIGFEQISVVAVDSRCCADDADDEADFDEQLGVSCGLLHDRSYSVHLGPP